MSNAKDLGLVNDMIVGVDKTSGDGSPGTVDTYAIRLRSGVTYPFTVTNGDACVKEFTIEKGSIGDEIVTSDFFDYLITTGFNPGQYLKKICRFSYVDSMDYKYEYLVIPTYFDSSSNYSNLTIISDGGVYEAYISADDHGITEYVDYDWFYSYCGNLNKLQTKDKSSLVGAINEVKNTQPHLYRLRLNISDTYWECLVCDIYNLPLGQTQLFNADKTQACTDAVRNDIIKIFREQMNGYFIWNVVTDAKSIICKSGSDHLIASDVNFGPGEYTYLEISFGDITAGSESWTCDANDDYDVYMEIHKVF